MTQMRADALFLTIRMSATRCMTVLRLAAWEQAFLQDAFHILLPCTVDEERREVSVAGHILEGLLLLNYTSTMPVYGADVKVLVVNVETESVVMPCDRCLA